MAKRKKTKTKSRAKATEADVSTDADVDESRYQDRLASNLDLVKTYEKEGFTLKPSAAPMSPENDKLLEELAPLISEEEMSMLKTCGAFNDVELQATAEGLNYIDSKAYQNDFMSASMLRDPVPPIPIFADFPGKSSKEALAGELRYLETVLHPAEMRWLVAELACDALEKAPVTHTDISDAVIASIAPSTAQKVAFQADAQYKYTTAQFLQVYLKMRHIILEHKIMLAGARADALLLAISPYNFEPLREEDIVPVSAVEALRSIGDKMIQQESRALLKPWL